MTEIEATNHIKFTIDKELEKGRKEGYDPTPFQPSIFGIKNCPIEGMITFEELKQMLIRQI